MRRFAAALALVGLGGCALAIDGPKHGAPLAKTPTCDRGRGGVVADGVLGAGFGVGGLVGLGNDEDGLGVASLLVGGLLVLSAVHGNGEASACDRAFVEHDEYVASLQYERSQPAPVEVHSEIAPAVGPTLPTLPTPAQAAQAIEDRKQPEQPEQPAPPADDDDRWSAFWEASP